MDQGLLQDLPRRIKQSTYKTFSISGQGVENKDLATIVPMLNGFPNITSLDLSINNLDEGCVKYLLDLQYIKTINLESNNINDSGALKLVKKFKRVYLIQNSLTKAGVKKIIDCKEAKFLMLTVEDEVRENGAMRWLPEETRQQLKSKIETNNDNHRKSKSCFRFFYKAWSRLNRANVYHENSVALSFPSTQSEI